MFFNQIKRNAAHNRHSNGLYFGSLVIAIVAFYTLLSLKEQDVMKFLTTIESDAVRKLLMLIPAIYVLSLFFVFFLVYFACRNQTDSRRREFGMYLMLGMKRSRLFFLLLGETLWNSVLSLLIGLPVAICLTEGISLITAKAIGLDIIGRSLTFSTDAILWTIVGFVIVQIFSMLIICIPYGKIEPATLLRPDTTAKQKIPSTASSGIFLGVGVAFLLVAYYLGLFKLLAADISKILVACFAMMALGILGTFFLFRGIGGFIGRRSAGKSRYVTGLTVFTGRQVQESVLSQHKSLAVSSLLLLVALSCISYGIAIGAGRVTSGKTTDFSLSGNEDQITSALSAPAAKEMVATSYPVYLSMSSASVETQKIQAALRKIDTVDNTADSFHADFLVAVSSYNSMMKAIGKDPLTLGKNEAALYSTLDSADLHGYLEKALKQNMSVEIDGTPIRLLPQLYTDNIVADRSITLYAALIVPDDLYAKYGQEAEPFCRNVHLKKSVVEKAGLMNAIRKMSSYLDTTGLKYDSYLGSIGRNLFYTVAASYLTIYLGVLFLLIANTAVGTKYLIQQRKNQHRYVTLLMLGADVEQMCASAKKQINMFFALVLGVAVCNSVVAILMLLFNFTRLPSGTDLIPILVLAMVALLAFVVTEILYIWVVKRNACREIRSIEITDRG